MLSVDPVLVILSMKFEGEETVAGIFRHPWIVQFNNVT